MKKIITVMSRQAAREVVTELAAKGIHGMTVIEAAPHSSLGVAMGDGAAGEDGKRDGAVACVRLETVVESHRADEVIELIEALLDGAEAAEPASARLVVEDVSAIVHIRSGRILT